MLYAERMRGRSLGATNCRCALAYTIHLASIQDMQGGKLTVAASGIDPEEHVQPETNLLVRFRGSATHRLRSLLKEQCCRGLY